VRRFITDNFNELRVPDLLPLSHLPSLTRLHQRDIALYSLKSLHAGPVSSSLPVI
jgi:hypothetical protein